MPRHYTDEEKHLVLDRLIANHGDVDLTVLQTGIPERTVARWKQLAQRNGTLMPMSMPPPMPPSTSDLLPSPVTMGEGLGLGVLPPETTEAFQELHDQLLPIAKILANRIIEAIDDAPLNQRMTALSQLIDRIAKLAALLPEYEDDDPDDKPFEIDYDVKPKEDVDEEKEEEIETISPSAESPSQPDQNPRKYSPF